VAIASPEEQLAIFESLPIAETSSPQVYERQMQIDILLSIRQAKRIEDVRDGKDPHFRIWLTALMFVDNKGFERVGESAIDLRIPRSHWIDHVLNVWKISDLRFLEIKMPSAERKEFIRAKERLAKAEHLYRSGDYANVLTSLRLAFDAVADAYGGGRAGGDLFSKILADAGINPDVRERLVGAFTSIRHLLHAGPHEPSKDPSQPSTRLPIGREEARFALIAAHAVFEYFSRNVWPGI
jgi:hypothetical protein